jgi:hypothetical protein
VKALAMTSADVGTGAGARPPPLPLEPFSICVRRKRSHDASTRESGCECAAAAVKHKGRELDFFKYRCISVILLRRQTETQFAKRETLGVRFLAGRSSAARTQISSAAVGGGCHFSLAPFRNMHSACTVAHTCAIMLSHGYLMVGWRALSRASSYVAF